MNYIKRIFKYVWPQWHRLIVIAVSSILIGILFPLNIVAAIPMLKVMFGQEGLRGYVNRLICSDRYGVKFRLPDTVELTDPNNPDVAFHLLVIDVAEDGLAEHAGIKPTDHIIGAGTSLIDPNQTRVWSSTLLDELAWSPEESELVIQYKRLDENSQLELFTTSVNVEKVPFYLPYIHKVIAYIPKDNTGQAKINAMVLIILLISVVTIIRCAATFAQRFTSSKVSHISITNLRQEVYEHILEMPAGYFDREKPTDAVSRLNRDITLLALGIKMIIGKGLREPAKMMGLICYALWLDWKVTLIFLLGAPLTLGTVLRLGKRIKRATKKSLISGSEMLGKLTESFNSVKVVKVYNQQPYESKAFGKINNEMLKQQLRIAKIQAGMSPLMEVVALLGACMAMYLGVRWVVSGNLDVGNFIAIIIMLGAIGQSVRTSSDIWPKVQQANAAGERVYGLFDEITETEKPNAARLPTIKESLEFRDIVFTYPGANQPVLNGLNLTVEAGHNIAIVGPNGSGKTTLVNLIPRFYDVDSGAVLIDETDVRDCTLKSLRNQIGLVTQKVVTFNDSIGANIAYGKSDATMDQVIASAKQARAHEFISQLPNGYDTIIGEQGTGLSGGQLQRIVIARAILKDPAILIFDEATSQVDAESEAKIHTAIEELMHNRTSFIIAHRFSTVLSADIIVVMDKGQIAAKGTHEELTKTCPLYQGLYETQLVRA